MNIRVARLSGVENSCVMLMVVDVCVGSSSSRAKDKDSTGRTQCDIVDTTVLFIDDDEDVEQESR